MIKSVLIFWFLIGCVAGLRAFTAPAVVCWAARFGWLHLAGTSLSFMDSTTALIIFTLLALGELVSDKLAKTPARTAPPQLITRIVMGALSGAALAVSSGGTIIAGVLAGAVGAAIATFAGYHIRRSLVGLSHLPDFAVALLEDLLAISGGLFVVSRL